MNCGETVIQLNLFIPQSHRLTLFVAVYMSINYLPAGGAVGESEVSTVTLHTKQSSAHKRCFIRHYTQDEMKITSNMF